MVDLSSLDSVIERKKKIKGRVREALLVFRQPLAVGRHGQRWRRVGHRRFVLKVFFWRLKGAAGCDVRLGRYEASEDPRSSIVRGAPTK
jgi:hypothetical protein